MLITNRPPLQDQAAPAAPRSFRVSSRWAANALTFLMVFGPGLIVMEADNDAGAVSTYVQAGAQYGTHLLGLLLVSLPISYFVQEMVVRLGIVTGQGQAAMIYRRFGKWWGRFSLADLLALNFLTLVTEFAAISLAVDWRGVHHPGRRLHDAGWQRGVPAPLELHGPCSNGRAVGRGPGSFHEERDPASDD
jgi:hypothetical protein